MIPEEDRGPLWLSDYGSTDYGDIAADIHAMQNFAAKLMADVKSNYVPHLKTVTETMTQRLANPPSEFYELTSFLMMHNEALNATHINVYNYANGTWVFGVAATDISKEYAGSDAFSHAKLSDVDDALGIKPTSNSDGGMS